MYQYPPLPQRPTPLPVRRSLDRRYRNALIFLAALALVIAAVTVYVLLERLSDQVLTVIATIGCASGVALPGLLMAMVTLLRRAENGGGKQQPQPPQMTQPVVTVIPPMAMPQLQQPPAAPQQPPPATWETIPTPRHFTVVGEE